jgi:hypothetical protein
LPQDYPLDKSTLSTLIPATSVGLLQRIIGGIQEERYYSWLENNGKAPHITVMLKLREKQGADLTDDLINSVHSILARHTNKLVLENIAETLEKAHSNQISKSTPKEEEFFF